jgi:hypothetical protein
MTTTPYVLTKLDIAAMNKADYLSVMLKDGTPRVTVWKRHEKSEKDPFAQDVCHVIDAPIRVTNHASGTINSGRFYASMDFWRRTNDSHIAAVVSTLRAGDGISFEFYPDCHTTENLRTAGLHGDVLRLHVTRGKHRHVFEIAQNTCPDNTARMCQGATRKEYSLA